MTTKKSVSVNGEEAQPKVEAIIISLGDARASQTQIEALLRHHRLAGWKAGHLGKTSADVALVPPKAGISAADAWTLTRTLLEDRAVADAEPAFRVPGADPRPHYKSRLGVRSAMLFPEISVKPRASADCEWSIKLCRLPEAWAYSSATGTSSQGQGIPIAHADTGYTRHPELVNGGRVAIADGYDFLTDNADALDPLTGSNPSHGTSTGSVIMSDSGPGAQHVTGAAPLATLVPLRCNDSVVYFSYLNLCKALYFAADHGWPVVSMSLGGAFSSNALLRALQYAAGKGTILVAASGNYYPKVTYPARYEETIACCACNANVLSLTAATIEQGIWKYAAQEDDVDITAPGESVWRARTEPPANYTVAPSDGTSYACATVAGIAAVWLAHHGLDNLRARFPGPRLPAVFKELVMSVGRQIPAGWRADCWGAGIIDAYALLNAPLPAAAPARGLRVAARRPLAQESVLDRIVRHFPQVPAARARKTIAETFGLSEEKLVRMLATFGSELEFWVATDAKVRADLLARMAPARGKAATLAKPRPTTKRTFAFASSTFKDQLK